MQESAMLVEKTVDCLRVLTSDNEANKLALFSIPAGVKSLIQIMIASKSMVTTFQTSCPPHDPTNADVKGKLGKSIFHLLLCISVGSQFASDRFCHSIKCLKPNADSH